MEENEVRILEKNGGWDVRMCEYNGVVAVRHHFLGNYTNPKRHFYKKTF